VRPEHLRGLLEELLRLDRARRPHGGAHATLLGVGDASLVPSARLAPLPRWTRWPHTHAPLTHKLVRACICTCAAALARCLSQRVGPNPKTRFRRRSPLPCFPAPQLLRETGGGWGAGGAPRRPAPSPRALALPPTLLGNALQRHRVLRGHRAAVYCAIFDAGGRRLITGSDDFLVKIWSAASGMLLRTCRGHEGEITYIAASADDTLAASASMDATIRTWRLADGAPMAVLLGHTQPVTELAFHPQLAHAHLLLSVSTDDTVRLWDAARNAAPALVLQPGVDEDALGAAADGGAGAGAAAAATTVAHVCCAFSPDGLLFAAGTRDFSALIWRLELPPPEEASGSGADCGVPPRACVSVVDRLRGHRNEISFVQFAASGDALLSGSKDGTVRVWRGPSGGGDAGGGGAAAARSRRSGRPVREPREPWVQQHVLAPPPAPPAPHQRRPRTPPAVNMVRWSGDGRTIVASLDDASLCLWDAAGGALLSRLRQHTREVFVVEPHPFDPRMVLTAGHDGHLFLWDVAARCVTAEWDLRSALPEDAMWLLDARWTPDGAGFVVSDGAGCVHLFGTGAGEARRGAKADQFFASDFSPLLRDDRGFVADVATNRPPHLARHELLCDYDPTAGMLAYGEPYQSAFQQGCVLIAGVPIDTERLRDPRVRAPPPARTPALAAAAPAGADAAQRPPRRLFRMSGAHAGANAGPSGVHADAIELLSSSSSSSSSDDDFEQDDSDGGPRRRAPSRRADRNYMGEDGDEPGSGEEEEEEEDGEEDEDGGGAHGDDDGDGMLRRSSRRLRARDEEERSRRTGLRARRAAAGGGRSDALAAAQPVYATRFAGVRRMHSMREESDSDDSDDEAARGRKRQRAASARGARAARHATRGGGGMSGSDEPGGGGGGGGARHHRARDYREVSDDDSPRRAQRRERDRARRARDREKKEARRRQRDRDRERRRRRAGGLSDEDGEDADGADAAGPSRYTVAPPATGYRPADKFAWLQQTERRIGEYVPQLGDAVVYLAQGHQEYLSSVGDALQTKPWVTIPCFRAAEPAVVTGLEYQIVKDKGDATVARLTLTLTDAAGALRGQRFELELPYMTQEGSPDFIIEYVRARLRLLRVLCALTCTHRSIMHAIAP
jgi:WD40 repeat protein